MMGFVLILPRYELLVLFSGRGIKDAVGVQYRELWLVGSMYTYVTFYSS